MMCRVAPVASAKMANMELMCVVRLVGAFWLVASRIVVGLVGAIILAWLIRRFAPRFANVACGGRQTRMGSPKW